MNRERDRSDGRAVERSLAGQGFEGDHTERPDVGAMVDRLLAEDLLRAHVKRRPNDLAGRRLRRRLLLLRALRDPEVEHLHEHLTRLAIAEEDVLWLDVPVDDAHLVGLRE